MSGIYPALQQKIPNVDPLAISGKALARATEQLDQIADALGLTTLMNFYSISPEELAGFLDDLEGDHPEIECSDTQWFSAEDGLLTIRGLRDHLLKVPESIKDPSAVIDDLDQIEKILEAAQERSIRFHLCVDY